MENMGKYVILKKGLAGLPSLVKPEDVINIIEKDKQGINTDWYQSVYYYNDKHAEQFKTTKSMKGITDVKTNKLVLDFDSATPDLARKDALVAIKRLNEINIKESNIEIFYSGAKGIHLTVTLKNELTPRQTALAAKKIAGDLPTFDPSLYDSAQILRVPWTKNQKSGLFKVPLTAKQLNSSIESIQKLAENINNVTTEFNWEETDLPETIYKEEPKAETKKEIVLKSELDLTNKPRHWPDYKWALLNAYKVKPEERHEALMRIAATARGLGYPEDMTRALCLTFDDKFTASTGKPSVEDLEDNILATVFSNKWNGGQYSHKNDLFLQEYAKRVGLEAVEDSTKEVQNISSIFEQFEDFSTNFEQNIIKTGIKELDDNSLFLTSTHNGILGQPGSGKTSMLIQWLEHLSSQNQHCFFYSLDMAEEIIGAKLIQRVTGLSFKEATKLVLTDRKAYEKAKQLVTERFKNVQFIFTSGTKVEGIEKTILNYEKETGNKIRFLAIDYLECLQGPYSDQTANTGHISQELKDLARKTKVCSVILLQTQKSTGGGEVSEPILSMKKIKGSSVIEQSASVLLTLWREGYNPKFQAFDKFMSFAIVKNRFGPLWTDDFNWDGASGTVGGTLGDEQKDLLEQLREEKKKAKAADDAEKSEWS